MLRVVRIDTHASQTVSWNKHQIPALRPEPRLESAGSNLQLPRCRRRQGHSWCRAPALVHGQGQGQGPLQGLLLMWRQRDGAIGVSSYARRRFLHACSRTLPPASGHLSPYGAWPVPARRGKQGKVFHQL